jgi:hypothetical protein
MNNLSEFSVGIFIIQFFLNLFAHILQDAFIQIIAYYSYYDGFIDKLS